MKQLLHKQDTDFVRDNMLINYCVFDDNALLIESFLKNNDIQFKFNLDEFYFCITGLDKRHNLYDDAKSFNLGVTGCLSLYKLIDDVLDQAGYLGNCFLIKVDNSKQIAILISPTSFSQLSLEQLIEKIHHVCLNSYLGDSAYAYLITTSISSCYSGYEGIHQAYLEARRYNNLSFFQFEKALITPQLVKQYQLDCGVLTLDEAIRKLRNLLCYGSLKEIELQIDHLFLELVRSSMQYHYYTLAASMTETAFLLFIKVYDLSLPLKKPQEFNTLPEYVVHLKQMAARLFQSNLPRYSFEVLLALGLIKDNYNQELSLTRIAENVNVNASYLSSEFNRQVGVSMPEAIAKVRIDQAKILLKETKLSYKEIAQMVGMPNTKYFSERFKKLTSLSPNQYRKAQQPE